MKKIITLKVLSAIVLGLIVFNTKIWTLYASNISFRNIKNEEGLSQSTVETMIQDRKGYIWIGTNDGLASIMVMILKCISIMVILLT